MGRCAIVLEAAPRGATRRSAAAACAELEDAGVRWAASPPRLGRTRTSWASSARRSPGGSWSFSGRTGIRRRPAPPTTRTRARRRSSAARSARQAWVLGEDSGIEAERARRPPGFNPPAGRETRTRTGARGAGRRRGDPAVRGTSASSWRSRPTARSSAARAVLEGRIAQARRGAKASATTRSSSPRARSERWRSSATPGRREHSHRARAARASAYMAGVRPRPWPLRPGPPLPPARPAAGAGEPPVDLCAEDDHVRHQVEPDEQQRRPAERLQGDHVLRHAQVHGQHLEARLERDRGDQRARQDIPRAQRLVRQQPVHRDQEDEDGQRREPDREPVGDDAVREAPAPRLRIS